MTSDPTRVALVTGAARGIGAAIVRELAATGDAVVACDVDHAAVVELAAGLSQIGLTCEPRGVDVTDASQVQRVVGATVERFGRVDGLVNNAGIGAVAPSEDLPRDVWDPVLGVNLTGSFLCAQAAGKMMLGQGRGVIVNVASIFGVVGMPRRAAYAASKHGLLGLTKVPAAEWTRRARGGLQPGVRSHPARHGRPTGGRLRRRRHPTTHAAGSLRGGRGGCPGGPVPRE